MLFKLNYYVPEPVLKLIYLSFIHTYLLYGIEAWFSTYANLTDKILVLQKKACRAICNLPYNAHTSDSFKNMRILKLGDIYNFQVAKIMYQAIRHGKYSNISDSLQFKSSIHRHKTRQINQLNIPKYLRSKTQSSLLYSGIKIWNHITRTFECNVSFSIFKLRLKEYYLSHY